MAAAVRRALRSRDRWLLIFDNAEDWQQIWSLLPGGTGHVLITTRRGGFCVLGSVVDLDILDRAEAIALLRRRVPDLAEAQAGQLAERLGDLPLALDQAAAHLDQTDMAPQDYLDLLGSRSADVHSRGTPQAIQTPSRPSGRSHWTIFRPRPPPRFSSSSCAHG